ncbi:MAG: efflux RND transporter periplasmic adaptor subunit, partial [Verrucomicrobiae bacterium]|nr:efflux RND transporter periplasmic adaptor subunit [Verrucomicrobiae bacterium]
MIKKILITIVGLGIIVAVIFGVKAMQIKTLMSGGAYQMPPVAVTSAKVKSETWKQTLDAVGSLTAVQGVVVSTEIAGKVVQLNFDSGQMVEKGQILVELDTSTEQAQLAAARAEVQLTTVNLERAKKLRESNTVPQAELDSAEANYLSAKARMENIEAVITKMKVAAPFSGRLGIREIDLGQFINTGQAIVSLQSLDPIFVDFTFPQQWISRVAVDMPVEVHVDAFPSKIFKGTISAIDPQVNASTRTINLRATLSNEDGRLLPGMFAEVSVVLPEEDSLRVVPATSVLYNSYGNSVFVIREKDGKKIVEQQFVHLGEARGDFVSLSEGPAVGSDIVSTGVFKLRNGVPILINNELA